MQVVLDTGVFYVPGDRGAGSVGGYVSGGGCDDSGGDVGSTEERVVLMKVVRRGVYLLNKYLCVIVL